MVTGPGAEGRDAGSQCHHHQRSITERFPASRLLLPSLLCHHFGRQAVCQSGPAGQGGRTGQGKLAAGPKERAGPRSPWERGHICHYPPPVPHPSLGSSPDQATGAAGRTRDHRGSASRGRLAVGRVSSCIEHLQAGGQCMS